MNQEEKKFDVDIIITKRGNGMSEAHNKELVKKFKKFTEKDYEELIDSISSVLEEARVERWRSRKHL